ncbi:DUF4175 family protein [uncultured Polaribacter sp.]|uniref:DUF4175 family protein n=1 Tax=uncultured Polaribacter sp. TaxID=174711 RepID=UPI00260C56B6|nr:DUF4175 family protein [uncultured Polaribacter sp.]
MGAFTNIEKKLQQFTRKYYVNELIKGTILFLSLGALYLFFTLFLEYFLWLKPTARTLLFWIFVAVEVFLLIRFIAIPIFKLIGLRKGISLEASSKIIGNHFPEVKDKLLNVLQLKESSNQTDLLLASINQKAEELQPIPFVKAIDFTKNKKYLKYAIVPIFIWLITLFTGNNGVFTESLERVVNHRTAYVPPAPFSFNLVNPSLQVIQGKPITITIETKGNVLPEESKILYNNQQYFLQHKGNGVFSYTFTDVQKPINFYVEANNVQSLEYQIKVIGTPIINNIILDLKYPYYVGKRNETIQNSGNLLVPEGTQITWKVNTTQTNEVLFINADKRTSFTKKDANNFILDKRINDAMNYTIASSNDNLQEYENLQFAINVVKDEVPSISVETNIDSITRGAAQFAGQISDDYGLKKLQLVYYDQNNPQNKTYYLLSISKANVQTFFYNFPEGLNLEEGVDYEFFFEVFDNDAVNGNKKAKSKVFNFRQKTNQEVEEELIQEQKNTINSLESSLQKQEKQQKELNKIQQELQNKKNLSWNDIKKVENFIKRQQEYKKMMQRQTDQLQENFEEKIEKDESLQQKKEELQKRIEELKKTDRQKKLLDEIAKMAEKLNKEDLVKKAKELAQQNKQQQRSLERMLELTKRFYVEQKTMQIANKLEELAKKQEELKNKKEPIFEEQEQINKEFKKIEKELEELSKDNEKLKEPMELPDVEDEKEAVNEELKNAEESIKKQDRNSTKKSQKNSAQKMKEMSGKMQKAMEAAAGESMEENMEDLRKILENLVTFSFKQENLVNKFQEISTNHPDFGKDLKSQNDIRTYFEHIDDSLYVLSMRLPKLSAKIQDDLSTAHYNLEQALENFSENRFSNGISNQRYVMTSTNNLADYLSNILNSMKNSSMKMGKGKGKGNGFSLPDIIKKQGELSEKMKKGMEDGKKPGEKPGDKPGEKPGEGKSGKKPGENGKPGQSGENGESGEGGEEGKNGKGKGKGKGEGNGKNGNGKSNKNGEGDGENDDLDGELYEIYKEQSKLRQQLQEAIRLSEKKGNGNGTPNGDVKRALKTMEQLENEILQKGFTQGTIQKMQRLNYELLKLDKAALEQGEDTKRKSTTNLKNSQRNKVRALEFKKQFYNQVEILNRQSLPLQQNYKIKVREYFSEPKKSLE